MARPPPGNQRRRVCLPSSVLALCPGVDSACGGSWSRLQIETFGSRWGLTYGCTAWRTGGVRVPECNFDTACLIGPWH